MLIEGDVADGIARLKREDGPELQVQGAGDPDTAPPRPRRPRLLVFPLVVGSGKRLFLDGTLPRALKLVDSTVSATGVVMGTYEPAGEIVTGSFGEVDR